MKYTGRYPDADSSIAPKGFVDARYDGVKVDSTYVAGEIATQAANLVVPSYVDTQDALRAHKTDVDTADGGYLPLTQRGAASGVAPLDGSAVVPSANLPSGIQTERKPIFLPATTVPFTSTQVLTTVALKGYRAATLTIADPGFPYIPLFFAMVQGASVNGTQSDPMLGTGNFGQIAVLRDSDDAKYSWCLTGSQKALDFSLCVPFADNSITPVTRPPLTGAQAFSLWFGLFSGSTYSFTTPGFNFFCMLYPGV